MINWTISHVRRCRICWVFIPTWVVCIVGTLLTVTRCTVPHDFGMYNNLKTICHVWKGRDGYRRQATMHINRKDNIHGSHHWDYDGECEE